MFGPHDENFDMMRMFREHAAHEARYLPTIPDNTVNPFIGFASVGANKQFMVHRELKIQDTIWPLSELSGINALVFDYGVNGFV